jgi:hypothetical protein
MKIIPTSFLTNPFSYANTPNTAKLGWHASVMGGTTL